MSPRRVQSAPMHAPPARWIWVALPLAAGCGPASAPEAPADDTPASVEAEVEVEPGAVPGDDLAARIRELEELGYASGYEPAPEVDGVTLLDLERAMPGLNLVVSAHAAEALLMDLEGRVVHRWARTFEDTWPGRSANAARKVGRTSSTGSMGGD